MIRLLLLTAETWPTFRADVSALFGKYLPRHAVYSDLVTGRTPGHEGRYDWGGGEALLCDVSGGRARKHIRTVLHAIRELLRADSTRYDAIQVRDMPVLAAFGLVAARWKGLPFFYWMSYPMPEGQIQLARERGLSGGFMKFLFPWVSGRIGRFLLYQIVLPYSDHVFVQSDRMKQDMIERGIAADKMTPVPMGVDLEAMRAEHIARSEDPRLIGRRVLAYLGTLERPRRIEILFDTLAEVRRVIPEAMLLLVGDTQDKVHRTWLQKQACRAGVAEHVVWTGWLDTRVGWGYVKSAEVGLSPFPRGFLLDSASPTKVPEYLALGVPVVCNDNPDQKALIEASGCGLCVPYTAQAFAGAVISILTNQEAQATDDAMAAKAREFIASRRSYARISTALSSVYVDLLGSSRLPVAKRR